MVLAISVQAIVFSLWRVVTCVYRWCRFLSVRIRMQVLFLVFPPCLPWASWFDWMCGDRRFNSSLLNAALSISFSVHPSVSSGY